ncbi:glycosyltransferase family 2 protein [Haladaptatus sp. DFWS20]|uniref:glycosyltransferase family 2 protein n=1 Tax=Haladaptatus sp. DFWS20 TaxID=3403467 RepID=UPI003EBDEDB7
MIESFHSTILSVEMYQRSENPDLSVVIPTIPDSEHHSVVIELSKQKFEGQFEIIVVNDDTIDACEARNIGLNVANADIVAFTDDDCIPKNDWINNIYDIMEDDSIICAEGKVTGSLNYSGKRGYLTSNLAVDRSEALAVGGFRSEYFRWREDTEFGWRMERDGDGSCLYSERIVVQHPTRPRAEYIHKNEKLLREEYPNRYKEILGVSIRNRVFRFTQRSGLFGLYKKLTYHDK